MDLYTLCQVDVTVPNDFSSAVVDMLNKRKGEMLSMGPAEGKNPNLSAHELIKLPFDLIHSLSYTAFIHYSALPRTLADRYCPLFSIYSLQALTVRLS